MWLLLVLLLFGHLFHGLLPGLLFAALGVLMLAPGTTGSEYLVLLAALVAVPLAGFFAGALIERSGLPVKGSRAVESLCVLCACALFLQTGEALVVFEGYLQLLSDPSIGGSLLLLGALGSAIAFCAGLIALIVSGLLLAVELPLHWVSGDQRSFSTQSLSGLRPLVILLVLSLSARLTVGLVDYELRPAALQQRIEKRVP